MTLKLGLIKLLQKTYDICQLDGVKCPLTLNNEGVATTFDLPKLLPVYQTILSADLISIRLTSCFRQTRYQAHIDAYSVDDEDLMCIHGYVTMK